MLFRSVDYRADWNAAHVVQAIMRDGKPLNDFMLRFGDDQRTATRAQSVEYQESLLNGWIEGNNLIMAAKGAK